MVKATPPVANAQDAPATRRAAEPQEANAPQVGEEVAPAAAQALAQSGRQAAFPGPLLAAVLPAWRRHKKEQE